MGLDRLESILILNNLNRLENILILTAILHDIAYIKCDQVLPITEEQLEIVNDNNFPPEVNGQLSNPF